MQNQMRKYLSLAGIVTCLLLCLSRSAYGDMLGTGLEISVSGDLVYDQGVNSGSKADEKLRMRGAEIMLYAPIDHKFEGVLSAAAHDENEETVFELHELFMSSSKLIPRSTLKAGQYFLGIGRLNRFHQHDWPFTRAPKVHRSFFAEEGVFDAGLEYGLVIPTKQVLNLTAGVTSGYRFGHSHTAGSKPRAPTHYGRLSSFFPFSSLSGLEVGGSYLGRTDAQGNELRLVGLDVTGKKRKARQVKYLLQSEAWYKSELSAANVRTEQVGLYVFNEFGLGQQTSVGFRLDGFKDLSKRNALTQKKLNNVSYGSLGQFTYSPSEFSKLRATVSHEFQREEGKTTEEDTRVSLQLIFIIGSHPAHAF